jgi:hypothetical protein
MAGRGADRLAPVIRARPRAVLFLGVVLLAVTAVSGLAAPKIDTGTYAAKLGHVSFRFKVIGYTPNRCGTHAGVHCFIDLSYPKVKEPCTNGQAENNVFAVPNRNISKAGKFSYFRPLHNPNPLISFKASFHGRQATGTLRERDVFDNGTGTLVYCDSGTLHWKATLQH